jgi:hypothetical protein
MNPKIKAIYGSILNGQHKEMGTEVQAALESGLHPGGGGPRLSDRRGWLRPGRQPGGLVGKISAGLR